MGRPQTLHNQTLEIEVENRNRNKLEIVNFFYVFSVQARTTCIHKLSKKVQIFVKI